MRTLLNYVILTLLNYVILNLLDLIAIRHTQDATSTHACTCTWSHMHTQAIQKIFSHAHGRTDARMQIVWRFL
jgi:hypothetical protein